jgi:YggT family protein
MRLAAPSRRIQFSRVNVASGFNAVVGGVKMALLALGGLVVLACLLDWAVRTRRINPFSRTARFARARIDPLMTPVERVIVRAGGVPTAAPLWMIVGYALLGILLVSALNLLGGLIAQVAYVAQAPRALPMLLASWAFSLLRVALLVRVISSWLPISPYSGWVRWSYILTEWMVAPLRRLIPTLGPIDITPIIAWLLLSLLQSILGIP